MRERYSTMSDLGGWGKRGGGVCVCEDHLNMSYL